MTREERRKLLSPIRCFLLDMDGTFYLGNRVLDGSLAFLDKLRETGRSALFLTNNSSKSAKVYEDKLRRMGVRDPFLRVFTSGQAAARYCAGRFPGGRAYVLGTEALRAEAAGYGVLHEEEKPDYVLIGYDTTLDYAKMTRVCDLVRAGLPYIATHPDFNCPTETGFAPDIGAIIAFIEASAGRRPDVILGKPYRGIMEEAFSLMGVSPGQTAMVGDRLYTDIAAGNNAGALSILVLTGEAALEDAAASPHKPGMIVQSLSSLIEDL